MLPVFMGLAIALVIFEILFQVGRYNKPPIEKTPAYLVGAVLELGFILFVLVWAAQSV